MSTLEAWSNADSAYQASRSTSACPLRLGPAIPTAFQNHKKAHCITIYFPSAYTFTRSYLLGHSLAKPTKRSGLASPDYKPEVVLS